MSGFADHFSNVASAYAKFRPNYPGALFEWIAESAPSRSLAWDVGCGSGQATVSLAEHFDRVIATDASPAQLEMAPERPNIIWRTAPAERSELDDHVADAITVAQALHWFDRERFWEEARRVGKPGGLLVIFSYGVHVVNDPQIDRLLHEHHFGLLGPYWPKERSLVDEGYASMEFPFERVPTPHFTMAADWDREQLLGYSSSWSAARRYFEATHQDPMATLRAQLEPIWGEGTRRIEWPLTVLAGRIS